MPRPLCTKQPNVKPQTACQQADLHPRRLLSTLCATLFRLTEHRTRERVGVTRIYAYGYTQRSAVGVTICVSTRGVDGRDRNRYRKRGPEKIVTFSQI